MTASSCQVHRIGKDVDQRPRSEAAETAVRESNTVEAHIHSYAITDALPGIHETKF